MSSSWLEPRFAFERGRVNAVRTAGLGAEGLKFTDKVPPDREMAFLRLKSNPMPCLPEEVAVNVNELIVGLPAAVRLAVQTALLAQVVEPAVTVEPVSLKNVMAGLDRET